MGPSCSGSRANKPALGMARHGGFITIKITAASMVITVRFLALLNRFAFARSAVLLRRLAVIVGHTLRLPLTIALVQHDTKAILAQGFRVTTIHSAI